MRLIAWPDDPPPHPADAARYAAFERETRIRVASRRVQRAAQTVDGAKRHRAVKRARDLRRRLMKKEARR